MLLVSSFIPQTEEALKDEIQRTFTLENFKPYMLPESATPTTNAVSSDATATHPNAATLSNPTTTSSQPGGDFTPPDPFPSYFHQYHFQAANLHMQQQGLYSRLQQLASQQAQRDSGYSNPRSSNGTHYNSQLMGRVQPSVSATVTNQAPTSTAPALPTHIQQPHHHPLQHQQPHPPVAHLPQERAPSAHPSLTRGQSAVVAPNEATNAAKLNASAPNVNIGDGTALLLPSIHQLEQTRTSDMVTNITDDVTSAAASSTINAPPAVPSIPPLLLSKYPVLNSVSNAGVVHDGGDPLPDSPAVLSVPGAAPSQGASATGFVDWGSVPPLSMEPAKLPQSIAAKISAMRNSLGAKLPRPLPAGAVKYNSGGIAAKAAAPATASASASSSVVSRTTVETVTSRSGHTVVATAATVPAPLKPHLPVPPPTVMKGVEYPYMAPFPYPAGYIAPTAPAHQAAPAEHSLASSSAGDAGSSADSQQAAEAKDDTDSDEEGQHPANTANLVLNKRKAALAAGPMVQGEDKNVQMQKAIAFYLDLEGTHHELSLTLVSEKFRLNHAKFKSALQL